MEVPEIIELFNHKLGWEGYNYCMTDYSDWREIKPVDPVLYEMVQEYRRGKPQQIRKYLKEKYGLERSRTPMEIARDLDRKYKENT